APLGSLNRPTDRHRPDTEAMQKARLAVHHRSACSGVKACPGEGRGRCETQAPLSGKPPALLAFRSLDPFRALRKPDRRRRDEERLSRSEQRTLSKTKTTPLTGKAPYRFESGFLHRRVCKPSVPLETGEFGL